MAETATWLTTLKLLSTVGEMAQFPYIGGVATCVITLLETIQAAAQNVTDLRELTESTRDTMDIVMETVKAHKDSAPHFRHVCEELEKYLKEVLKEMKKMDLKKNRGLKRFIKAKSISASIAGFKQRVQKIKEDFMIRVMTESRFAIAELEDKLIGLEDKLNASTDAFGTSQRDIQKEIHAVGTLQNEKMDAMLSSIMIELQACRSSKELVGDLSSYSVRLWNPMETFKPVGRVVLVSDVHLLEAPHDPISMSWTADNRRTSGSQDYSLAWANKAACVYNSQSSASAVIARWRHDFQTFISWLFTPK